MLCLVDYQPAPPKSLDIQVVPKPDAPTALGSYWSSEVGASHRAAHTRAESLAGPWRGSGGGFVALALLDSPLRLLSLLLTCQA